MNEDVLCQENLWFPISSLLDKWVEIAAEQACKGKQWTFPNYILVNPLDMLTVFQAFDVKANVDQTNWEIRLHFFFYAYNYIKIQTSH